MSQDIVAVMYQGLDYPVYLTRESDGKYHCGCGKKYSRARDIKKYCGQHQWDGKSGSVLVSKQAIPKGVFFFSLVVGSSY